MNYSLWHGDCLEEMDSIPDGSIDAIIADLPYGTTANAFDVRIPFEPLWKQYKRVIKKRGAIVLFGSQPFTSMLVMSNPEWFRYTWVWNKNNSAAFATVKYHPFFVTEDICVFGKTNVNYYPQMEIRGEPRTKGYGGAKSSCYYVTPIKGEKNNIYYPKNLIHISKKNALENLHPSQKPVALLSYLIKTYTNEGETVLDNTMGSGSTGEACLLTGRKFIGIEKDAHYFDIATQRLARVAAELRGELTHLPLFAADVTLRIAQKEI